METRPNRSAQKFTVAVIGGALPAQSWRRNWFDTLTHPFRGGYRKIWLAGTWHGLRH